MSAAACRKRHTGCLKRGTADLIPAALLGGFYAAACLLGGMLENDGYLSAPSVGETARTLLQWALFTLAILLLWRVPARSAGHSRSGRGETDTGRGKGFRTVLNRWDALTVRRRNLLLWLLMMGVCMISLLSVYPGFFVYDAAEELAMVQARSFTTHHPLLHVLLLGGVIQAVHLVTGSYNAGIFFYLLLQTAVILAIFVYMLADIRRRGAGRGVRVFGLLWLLLCPTVTMYVICSCKDGLFSAALILMTVELRCLFAEPARFYGRGSRHPFLFVCSAVLMMLLRNNGSYAYAVFLALCVLGALAGFVRRTAGKGEILRTVLLLALPFLLYCGSSRALAAATHAQADGSQEILTVPLMQLARTWNTDPDSFTEDEKQLMEELMKEDGWERYNPVLSDQMKVRFRSDVYRLRRAAFWRMWLRQALDHPGTYLNAWLLTSYGFWYPDAVIDCYEGNVVYTYTYGESSYFGYETEPPGVRRSLIPALDAWYRMLSLDPRAQKVPVLHWILSPGAMFWVFAFMLVTLARRQPRRLSPGEGTAGASCVRPGKEPADVSGVQPGEEPQDISCGRPGEEPAGSASGLRQGKRTPCCETKGSQVPAYLPVLLVWMTVLLGPCTLPRYVVYLWFGLPLFAAELEGGRAVPEDGNG